MATSIVSTERSSIAKVAQSKDKPDKPYEVADRLNRIQRAFNGWKAEKAIP